MRPSLVIALYFEIVFKVLVLLQPLLMHGLMLVRCRVLIKLDAADTAVMLEAFSMVTIDSNSSHVHSMATAEISTLMPSACLILDSCQRRHFSRQRT